MTLKGILATTFAAQDRKSLVLAVIIAAAALVTIAGFHQQLVQDRVLLIMYLMGIMVAAYVLVKRRALALMELVVFAAIARTLLGVHLAAAPGMSNHIMAVLSDITFWFVLLYLGWRLAAEAYRFQREEIRYEVRREVEAKAAAERGTALITASRDIRQPLTVIRTIIDGLLFEPDDAWSDSQHESLTDLDRHVSCLMVLVDNLLDYGQVEARKVNIRCEPVSVAELIEQCVASTHARAAKLGVEIRTHVQNDVGLVVADPIRLRQIVFTLLANAVDFSKDGGAVNLQVRKNDEHLMLSVRDTGKGVAEQEMESLFDPYREDTDDDWRIHASLGLSLAKRLVEIHGGSMTTDSVADSGTVFTIRLPLDASEYIAKHSPTSEPSSAAARTERNIDDFIPRTRPERNSNSRPEKSRSAAQWLRSASEELEEEPTRVLVADANPSVRRILRQWLSALDCETIEAENGIEALELAQSRPSPHLVLLDAKLPKKNGFDVCRAMKADSRLQLIPAILATAIDTPEEKIRAYEAGADDFLVKPINRADLTVRLRTLLRIYQFNQELVGAEGVALTLARAVAVKDGYSQAHIGMVANYSVMLGEKLGMDVAELKTLKYGAILHNVGKISIPDYILEKQDPLTPREMALIHQHPEIGCEICSPLKPLRPVLSIIRHHKERWDGNGYPDRLKGDAIPLGAQIVGLVDAYTALVSDRPYRRAMSHDEAIGVLRKQAAEGRYNPALLDRLMDCFDNDSTATRDEEIETALAEEMAV